MCACKLTITGWTPLCGRFTCILGTACKISSSSNVFSCPGCGGPTVTSPCLEKIVQSDVLFRTDGWGEVSLLLQRQKMAFFERKIYKLLYQT
jgi:hypothetical protein